MTYKVQESGLDIMLSIPTFNRVLALEAEEAVWVELLTAGRHVLPCNGLATPSTGLLEVLRVILFAVVLLIMRKVLDPSQRAVYSKLIHSYRAQAFLTALSALKAFHTNSVSPDVTVLAGDFFVADCARLVVGHD